MNTIYFIVLSLFVMIYIIHSVRKGNLSIKTSGVWIFLSFLMLFFAIFPYTIDWLSKFIGVSYPPALFLTFCVVFLFIQNFNFSKKIAVQQEKIIDLAQQVSILKEEVKSGKK